MKSVAVIGASGQVGTDLVEVFKSNGWFVEEILHKDLAIEVKNSVDVFFKDMKPSVIINTAAMHQVTTCEHEPERAWNVNFYGAKYLAEVAQRLDAVNIFLSTDYVFSGEKGSEYSEADGLSPLNVYGSSKAAGEIVTLNSSEKSIVARISSVFGKAGSSGKGGNFVETIIAKAQKGEVLKVVDDLIMSPSYTKDIANKIYALINYPTFGTFHLSNSGSTSWYEFAREICRQVNIDVEIERITSNANSAPRRPMNSSLSTKKIESLGVSQRNWKDALNSYLNEKGHL